MTQETEIKPDDQSQQPVTPTEKLVQPAAGESGTQVAQDPTTAASGAENAPAEVWPTTGHEVGDSVLSLLKDSGVGVDAAKALVFDAMQAGDPTKIDRDALVEKVGKAQATLILAGVQNFVDTAIRQAQAAVTAVHEAVGGQENWTKVRDWARSALSETDLAEYRAMIDAGGKQAKFAASEMLAAYNAVKDHSTITPAGRVEPRQTELPDAGEAFTRAQYVAALEKAHLRGRRPTEQELAEINAKRNRGRARGI